MACFHPLKGWKDSAGGWTSNRSRSAGVALTVPCGQCRGCRLERSRQWAVRIMHEAQLHPESCFITLTYAPEHIPPYGSLRKSDFQKFMKRLRKHYCPRRIRFFHCGEYGDNFSRPHYHAALFGLHFSDRISHRVRSGSEVYRSPTLERLWPFGLSEIGSLTFESAAYMARYVMKKVTGERAQDHYEVADAETGEVVELEREYTTMSRRPGIGRGWFEKYQSEVFPDDEVVMRGALQRPPQYYFKQLKEKDPELAAEVAELRRASRQYWNETEPRLAVREEVAAARLSTFQTRGYESGS